MDNPALNSDDGPDFDLRPSGVQQPEKINPGFSSKVVETLRHIVVEPIIFFHMTIFLMTQLCLEDFMLDRACRVNFNFSTEVCDALVARQVGNYTEEETSVQKLIAVTATWRSAIEYSLPCLIVLFLGSWSDRAGRRLPLILPQIGTVIKIAGLIVCSLIDSVDANVIAVVSAIPSAATGGYPLFSMAYNSYIGGTSSKENRTVRFGIANVFSSLGYSAGSAITGTLLTKTMLGHAGVLMICVAVEILVVVYTFIFISSARITDQGLPEDSEEPTLKSICSSRSLWTPFTLLYKTKGRRLKLILICISYFLAASPFYGEPVVLYIFTRYQLNWDAGTYGLFSLVRGMAQTAGVFVAMSVLSAWLRMSDPMLGALCSISQLSSCLIYAFAKTTGVMYTAAGVDVFNGAMTVVSRSMASKLVGADEQGKLHSLVAISDTINPIISNVIYGALYRVTLDVLPGAFFLLSGADTIPPLIIFLYFMFTKDNRGNKPLFFN